jgi:predicted HTH domain antitoxin
MPYLLRLPRHLIELVALRAQEERIDRSIELRQLLFANAEEYALELLSRGWISLSKAAELLDVNTLAVMEKAQERGIQLGEDIEGYRRAEAATR